ncbi:MAG: hypothetical protein JSR50_00925 [Proteobacteria bacterium]|nr:hypothetical protein [Pseudomonadota bacterium]
MIVRLLLVILVMLNLSAAAWWLFHRDPASASAATASTIPALKLVDAAHAPSVAAEAASPAIPADAVCASFGPFADASTTEQARQQLRTQAIRVDVRQVAQAGRGYDVILAATDAATGAALLERLKAAGIKDMFAIRDGADAGGVALGHFGSQEGAQRRLAELQGKGFQPRIRPAGQATFWLDAVAANGFDPAAMRIAVHAPHGERVSCPAASG